MRFSYLQRATFAVGMALSACAFAVGTSHWTQTNASDWRNGTFDNVVATNLGDLKLSHAVKTLLEQDPKVSSVNALVEAPDGTLYAGTGPHGILLRVKGDKTEQVATIDDATGINCLSFDNKGRLLIGTSGDIGRVYRLDKPGDKASKPVEVFKAEGVQYVWAMQQTPDGDLYVATGPNGQLFEVKPDGSQKVLLDSDENNLTTLLWDGKQTLYVGTDPNGLVFRVNRKTGDSFVLYDAPEAEISALVLDKQGNLFAATAEAREEGMGQAPGTPGEKNGRPEGGQSGVPITSKPPKEPKPPQPPQLPKPVPGKPNPIPKSTPGKNEQSNAIDGMQRMMPGSFYAMMEDPGAELRLDDPEDAPQAAPHPGRPSGRPTSGPTGAHLRIGRQPTVESPPAEARPEGNAVYKIDPEGFVTEVFREPVLILAMVQQGDSLLIATGSEGQIYEVNPQAEETAVLAKVEPKQITALLPGQDGRLYMGTANVGSIQAMSTAFASKGSFISPVLDATQISRFGKMQIHGTLADGTAIKIATRSGNVHDASEKGWSKWSDDQNAAEFMQVKSPSARFLQYRLSFTNMNGKHTPVVADVDIAYQVPNLPPRVTAVKVIVIPADNNGEPSPNLDPPPVSHKLGIAWEANDPNNDPLIYSIHVRSSSESPWILLKDKLDSPMYEWDTRTVADGRYQVKITASDAAANEPGHGKTASRVSDPLLVDNTPPVIGDLKTQQSGASVTVSLRVADHTGTVAAAAYSVDSSKDWQAFVPSDNIWDSPDETATFMIHGMTPGKHQVAIRAVDAKGNVAYENVFVTLHGGAAEK